MSSFDPSSSLFVLPSKWLFLTVPTTMLCSYWTCPSSYHMLYNMIVKLSVPNPLVPAQSALFGCSVFMFILTVNMSAILPLSFIPTTHLTFNFSQCLTLWLCGLTYELTRYLWHLSASMVPSQSPILLSPFLVLVEIVSLLIQPISLSVRLMANLLAGHIILTLLEVMILQHVAFSPVGSIVYILGLGFETMVCVIQAYVVYNLLVIYWNKNVTH
nr:ATP synthase 6 [Antarctophthirus microchir]